MIHLNEAVIVEGKYDRIKLQSVLDAVILETHGFSIFKDKEQMALIRRMAETHGVVVLTDSDRAGFLIRNYLRGALPAGRVKHVYIPDIYGKERRKRQPSKEGKLGVEGIPPRVLEESLRRAGVPFETAAAPAQRITKADLYEAGLTGRENSLARRTRLLIHLQLPRRLAPNGMLEVLNALLTRQEFFALAEKLDAPAEGADSSGMTGA